MITTARTLVLVLVLGLLVLPTAAGAKGDPADRAKERAQVTEVQILALNDFHGGLEPVPATSSAGRIGATPAGGVEFLASHVDRLRATNPNTLFVSAGDLIGATPLISALFHDEPTIEAFNLMGLDYNGVGNHEFDEGVDELLRMQNGGCHPVDGCIDGDPFAGATFDFLAANVKYRDTGKTIFPPYAIHHFPGVKIAVVGMTLEGTPSIVSPAGIQSVNFLDEAESVNALVPELKRQNVETIIVLLHEGGTTSNPLNETTINDCGTLSGPLPPIVEAMDDEIDVVVTGHTNWAVNCNIDGKVVTGAAAGGRLITDIDLTISRATKDVVVAKVENKIVTRDVPMANALSELVAKYKTIAAPIANRVIGQITADILRAANPAGESALGDVIADAQLDATDDPGFGDAVVAFMNPGGIRADLTFASSPAGEGDGNVTYGEMFTVQPFGNSMVTMTLTGAQIERLLEEQFAGCTNAANRILQVSIGFAYTWKASGGACDKVDPATIQINGVTVVPGNSYRVTVNSFLADGGDSFPILTQGTSRLGGEVDTDALEDYFVKNSPVVPGPQNRITRVP
ncbi:MAG TPA: bifunctional metallophosphatase/5'-nucleotidase [Gaiellaceae bacterium]|nr:bifunctional metallophosphatase/5'-nucleotidase [Gaiellaceae bacterium]